MEVNKQFVSSFKSSKSNKSSNPRTSHVSDTKVKVHALNAVTPYDDDKENKKEQDLDK